MCRMFFITSKKDIPTTTLLYYLLDSDKSIVKQAEYNQKRLQGDGWGIGYFNKKPFVFKSSKPIYDEKELLKEKISAINTKNLIIHVRRASNPRNIKKEKLISIENTQPFYSEYHNIIFTHNGTLNIVDEIYNNLGKYKKFVKGLNDSEVLFWHFIKNLDAYGDILESIYALRRELNTVWISVKKQYKKFKKPYNGLNIFIFNGRLFYALSDFKMEKEIFSLMTPKWEYGSYAIRKFKDTFIISSEPLDNDKWEKITFNHMLVLDIKDLTYKLYQAEKADLW